MPRDNKTKASAPAKAGKPYNKAAGAKGAKKGGQKGKVEKKAPAVNPLFEKRPRNFGIGQAIQPKRDLTRFVRWPKYIRMQRQKRVLYSRLKVPPAINQFTNTLPKNHAIQLFSLLDKYKPETRIQKAKRLKLKAEAVAKKEAPKEETRPDVVKYGVNHVTSLVESKEAKLVLIAHDVDPIELVLWLPALCRKVGVPYAIVKGKARLGKVVGKKTATVLALTTVEKGDAKALEALQNVAKDQFNNNDSIRKVWGGGVLGKKSVAAIRKKTKAASSTLTQ